MGGACRQNLAGGPASAIFGGDLTDARYILPTVLSLYDRRPKDSACNRTPSYSSTIGQLRVCAGKADQTMACRH